MMILRTLVCSTLFVSLAFADSPAPAAPVAARPHTQLRVDTVKPALTRRDSLTLQGAALSEARGGWTYSAEAKTVANKIVITVDGSAEPGAVVAKNETPFKATVEVVELKDKRVGTYELEVRGGKGERLWVGSWVDGKVNEDTGCPRGEDRDEPRLAQSVLRAD